ncbi:MAG TPA: hypothetical protein PKA37_10800 [Planctomycetota bacterium]|nr:hypothetical protein [Planctomycetota bacterium]
MTTKPLLLFLGEFEAASTAQSHILWSLHAAASAEKLVLNTRWIQSEDLAHNPAVVTEADGIVLVPGSKRRFPVTAPPMMRALTLIRETDRPFLALGSTHHLVGQEASTALSSSNSSPAEAERIRRAPDGARSRPSGGIWDEPVRCDVQYQAHPDLYGAPRSKEEWVPEQEALLPTSFEGLVPSPFQVMATVTRTGQACLMRRGDLGYHWVATFLPDQESNERGRPHALYESLVRNIASRP